MMPSVAKLTINQKVSNFVNNRWLNKINDEVLKLLNCSFQVMKSYMKDINGRHIADR